MLALDKMLFSLKITNDWHIFNGWPYTSNLYFTCQILILNKGFYYK